jgi:hypothetical protein
MEADWIEIYRTPDQPYAWIIRNTLESEGIQVVIMDKTSSPYMQFVPGEIELYVHTNQAEAAIELIYALENSDNSTLPE